MSRHKIFRQVTVARFTSCLLIIFILYCNNLLASEKDSTLIHDSVRWTRLVYEASAFFVTLETEIKLNTMKSDLSLSELVLNKEPNVLLPKGENIFRIDNFSEGFGKKTHYTLWFDRSGEALQRKKLVRGKKNEIKIYRFTDCGYHTLRQKFPDKKFAEDYSQWTASNKSFTGFERELCDGGTIYDVNALLYLIGAINIKDVGFEKELLTFSSGRLLKVKLVAKKKTSVYSEFKIKSPNKNVKVEDEVDVIEVQLIPDAGDKKGRESFRFLGLKGDVKVYVDPVRQLIVRLRGKVDVLGTLDINLKKAELLN